MSEPLDIDAIERRYLRWRDEYQDSHTEHEIVRLDVPALIAEVRRLRAEADLLRGAMRADDERLRVAGERVGIVAGCDTAEDMADEILRLRALVGEVGE